MKKSIALIVILALSLCLFGCTSQQSDNVDDAGHTISPPPGGDGITTEDSIVKTYREFFMDAHDGDTTNISYEEVVKFIGVEGLLLSHEEDDEEEDESSEHDHFGGTLNEGEAAYMWKDTSLEPPASMTIIFHLDGDTFYIQGDGFLDGVSTDAFIRAD